MDISQNKAEEEQMIGREDVLFQITHVKTYLNLLSSIWKVLNNCWCFFRFLSFLFSFGQFFIMK